MRGNKHIVDFEKSPTAWFCVLETARERGDFTQAAEAQKQLQRLGVVVRYCETSRSAQPGGSQS